MRQVILVGCINKGVDTVVDVLLDRVVHTALTRWRTCAVIIDAQTTTAIHEINIIPHLMQLDIELRGFTQSRLDAADLCDL